MAVIRSPLPHASYTALRNCWLRDPRISLKAKGLLGYLASHTEGYKCSQAQMVRESADGKEAVRSGLDELEANGYLTRVPTRSAGRFAEDDYALTDPFDAEGQLPHPYGRETRLSAAGDRRETHQSGFSAAAKPLRETRPLEDQWENTNGSPSDSLVAGQLALVPPHDPFDDFWAAYPKKVGKDAARRAWAKASRRADPAKIVAVARCYPFRSDRQFVKDPATWLNAGCWEDDLDAVSAANRPRNVSAGNYGPGYRNPTNPGAFEGPL